MYSPRYASQNTFSEPSVIIILPIDGETQPVLQSASFTSTGTINFSAQCSFIIAYDLSQSNGLIYNLVCSIDGTLLPAGGYLWAAGIHSFSESFSTYGNDLCGQTGSFSFSITPTNPATSKLVGTASVLIADEAIFSTTDMCGYNTVQNVALSTQGYGTPVQPNPSHTWTISQTGWQINGNATPYTLTATGNNVNITTPGVDASATLNVSGDNICNPIVQPLYCHAIAPPTPTASTITPHRIGSSCDYSVSVGAVARATYYIWDVTSSFSHPFTTPTNSGYGFFEQNTSSPIYVKAANGCAISSYAYKNVTFLKLGGVCQEILTDNLKNPLPVEILYDKIIVNLPESLSERSVQLISIDGKIIVAQKINGNRIAIPLPGQLRGLYILRFATTSGINSQKIFIQ